MIIEIIALVIFLAGLGGAVFMFIKKTPILLRLPEVHEGVQKENIAGIVKKLYKSKIKPLLPDKMVLLKLLSNIRVFVLKVEKQIDTWLQKMRKKVHAEKQQEKKDAAEKEEEKK